MNFAYTQMDPSVHSKRPLGREPAHSECLNCSPTTTQPHICTCKMVVRPFVVDGLADLLAGTGRLGRAANRV